MAPTKSDRVTGFAHNTATTMTPIRKCIHSRGPVKHVQDFLDRRQVGGRGLLDVRDIVQQFIHGGPYLLALSRLRRLRPLHSTATRMRLRLISSSESLFISVNSTFIMPGIFGIA